MKEYVVGFLFDGKGNVALINKTHPEWQKCRLNGIGGHLEVGETPLQAMNREFKEEAGCDNLNWRRFCRVYGNGYKLHLYRAESLDADIKSMTDELVGWYAMNKLPDNILPILSWAIPMANYKNVISAKVYHPLPEC
jgi:8-oxo-dGTP diphosphatase